MGGGNGVRHGREVLSGTPRNAGDPNEAVSLSSAGIRVNIKVHRDARNAGAVGKCRVRERRALHVRGGEAPSRLSRCGCKHLCHLARQQTVRVVYRVELHNKIVLNSLGCQLTATPPAAGKSVVLQSLWIDAPIGRPVGVP